VGHLRNLLLAARWTVSLSLIAFIGGGVVGLLLLMLRLSKRAAPSAFVSGYVQLFQGVPLLMQLFLAYYGMGLFGINDLGLGGRRRGPYAVHQRLPDRDLARLRGCHSRGQWEASQSLALNFGEQLRYVVLPQAVRIAIPPTVGFLVQVIKGTALASVIGFMELTKVGNHDRQRHAEARSWSSPAWRSCTSCCATP
jgi:polar amino acid transport system permease protein